MINGDKILTMEKYNEDQVLSILKIFLFINRTMNLGNQQFI